MILNLLNNASDDVIHKVGLYYYRLKSLLFVTVFVGFSYYNIFPN
jgi:hypothetical protein